MNNLIFIKIDKNEFIINPKFVDYHSFVIRLSNSLIEINLNTLEKLETCSKEDELEGRLSLIVNSIELQNVVSLLQQTNVIIDIPIINCCEIIPPYHKFKILLNKIDVSDIVLAFSNITNIEYVIILFNENDWAIYQKTSGKNKYLLKYFTTKKIFPNSICKIFPIIKTFVYNLQIEKINKEYSKITIDFKEHKKIINKKEDLYPTITFLQGIEHNPDFSINYLQPSLKCLIDLEDSYYSKHTKSSFPKEHKDNTSYSKYKKHRDSLSINVSTKEAKITTTELLDFYLPELFFDKNYLSFFNIPSYDIENVNNEHSDYADNTSSSNEGYYAKHYADTYADSF